MPPLLILFGTQFGKSEKLAKTLESKCKVAGIETCVKNMANFKMSEFNQFKYLAVIVSTYGMGEPPFQAEKLHRNLHSNKAPDLSGIKYSVLALGDSGYAKFCKAGKDFDLIIKKLGGKNLIPIIECDLDYKEKALGWMKSLINLITKD